MYFELYKDAKSQYRWRLWAANGRIIAESGEGYVAKVDCINGIRLVMSASVETRLEDNS